MPRQASRAVRLDRHWAHGIDVPATLGANEVQIFDLLAAWRGTFGTPFTGTMTAMRILGTVNVLDRRTVAALVGFGIVTASIQLTVATAPNPLSSATEDFTNWLYWKGFQTSNVGEEDSVYSAQVDVKGMRKFDPSRESIWLVTQSVGGAAAFVDTSATIRILCGD